MRTIMTDAGSALMGIGQAGGENRAVEAAKQAIASPLLEESVEGATGILLNITGGSDIGLFEINEAAEVVQSAADTTANIIFGSVIDEQIGDEVRVTVIATGFDHGRARPRAAREETRDRAAGATAARAWATASARRSRSRTTRSTSRRSCAIVSRSRDVSGASGGARPGHGGEGVRSGASEGGRRRRGAVRGRRGRSRAPRAVAAAGVRGRSRAFAGAAGARRWPGACAVRAPFARVHGAPAWGGLLKHEYRHLASPPLGHRARVLRNTPRRAAHRAPAADRPRPGRLPSVRSPAASDRWCAGSGARAGERPRQPPDTRASPLSGRRLAGCPVNLLGTRP